MPIHLHPTAPLAERVLLPGDPGRALALAQSLLGEPRMFNHNRGLWGYTGEAADGAALTIQSTGMGGPSAAIVLEELIGLGARRFVRVGTCGAVDPRLQLGELVIAERVHALDGTSRALGAGSDLDPDAALTAALRRGSPDARRGLVVCGDVFYGELPPLPAGALALEMESAALLAVGRRRGVAVACVLAVSDLLALSGGSRERIGVEALRTAGERVGAAGFKALT
ncbi:MAG: purine-nucleoside phosphorylase [Solirubrobacteraceae bacterium]